VPGRTVRGLWPGRRGSVSLEFSAVCGSTRSSPGVAADDDADAGAKESAVSPEEGAYGFRYRHGSGVRVGPAGWVERPR
jgi:hypothetical protein